MDLDTIRLDNRTAVNTMPVALVAQLDMDRVNLATGRPTRQAEEASRLLRTQKMLLAAAMAAGAILALAATVLLRLL
jgi:hypothetical protein